LVEYKDRRLRWNINAGNAAVRIVEALKQLQRGQAFVLFDVFHRGGWNSTPFVQLAIASRCHPVGFETDLNLLI